MPLQTILAERRRLNAAKRFELNMSATRPAPVYQAPLQSLARNA